MFESTMSRSRMARFVPPALLALAILAFVWGALVDAIGSSTPHVSDGATNGPGPIARVLDDDEWLQSVRTGRYFSRHPGGGTNSETSTDPFGDEDGGEGGDVPPANATPGVTYRTLCVRECDGAYFPISTSTTKDHFAEDERMCQSRCSSPAKLFVYPNGSGSPETMVDIQGRPYESQPNAFLFRSKYLPACKCRPNPWEPEAIARHKLYATKGWEQVVKKVEQDNLRRARQRELAARKMSKRTAKNGAVKPERTSSTGIGDGTTATGQTKAEGVAGAWKGRDAPMGLGSAPEPIERAEPVERPSGRARQQLVQSDRVVSRYSGWKRGAFVPDN